MASQDNRRWMTTAEAAEYLRITPHQLTRLRRLGKGPRCYCREGTRSYRYLQFDLDAWVRGGSR